MRQGIALPWVAALAVLSAATTLHAQCTPIVRSVSQQATFPNLVAGPIATDGTRLGLAKRDGTTTTPAIYFQLFDANLNSTTADRQVAANSADGPVALFYADVDSGGIATPAPNEFGLFYKRTDGTLMLQRIDTTGNPITAPIVMPHSWSFNDEFDIAWDHALGAYAIEHFVGDRPCAWVDDEHSDAGRRWAESRTATTLLLAIDPGVVMACRDVERLVDWASNLR